MKFNDSEVIMSYQTLTVIEKENSLLIKILEKRIYLGVTDIFAEELNKALDRDFENLILDLENVSVMNSSGIGVLIKVRDELSKKGKKIKIVNLQPLMTDIFTRMRLDTLFEFDKKSN